MDGVNDGKVYVGGLGDGSIYAIGIAGFAWTKIGYTSTNVKDRLQQLQTATPFNLHVVAEVHVGCNGHSLERTVHRLLRNNIRKREWFNFVMTQKLLEILVKQAQTIDAKGEWLFKLRYVAPIRTMLYFPQPEPVTEKA